MVQKRTAVKCAEKYDPDRYIVLSYFAKPNGMIWATYAYS